MTLQAFNWLPFVTAVSIEWAILSNYQLSEYNTCLLCIHHTISDAKKYLKLNASVSLKITLMEVDFWT